MTIWLSWFIALWRTSVTWLTQHEILGVPLIAFIIAIFIMGVTLRALLYKA